MSTEQGSKQTDSKDFISPTDFHNLISEISNPEGLIQEKRAGRTVLYLRKNPKLYDLIWKTLYPKRNLEEQPPYHHFPLGLELEDFAGHDRELHNRALGVFFSNTSAIDILWNYDFRCVSGISTEWGDRHHQNWVQYNSWQSACLLSEDPWAARIDRRILEVMDGTSIKDTDFFGHIYGNLISVSHYPTIREKKTTIQILYHFGHNEDPGTARYLASRVLGEKGKVINEHFNHYLFYDNQTETILVPGIGQYEFVAQMPIPRLIRNIFFPTQSSPRNSENPSRESIIDGTYPNFWEINYAGEKTP